MKYQYFEYDIISNTTTTMGGNISKDQKLGNELIYLDRQRDEIERQIKIKARERLLAEINPSKLLFDYICKKIEECDNESKLSTNLRQQLNLNNKIVLFCVNDGINLFNWLHDSDNITLSTLFPDLDLSYDELDNDCPIMKTYNHNIINESFSKYKIIAYRKNAIPSIPFTYIGHAIDHFIVEMVKK